MKDLQEYIAEDKISKNAQQFLLRSSYPATNSVPIFAKLFSIGILAMFCLFL